MRFEDEQFVKVFLRDTVTWKMLNFDERGLLLQILRKVDRAGIMDLKGHDVVRCVAAMIDAPIDRVERHLPALLEGKEPVLQVVGESLVWPRYLPGQSSQQSSTARSRAHRARRRDVARAQALGLPVEVPSGDAESESDRTAAQAQQPTAHGPENNSHNDENGTLRPKVGRHVPFGDAASQKGTPRLDQTRSERGRRRSTRDQPAGPSAHTAKPPVKTLIPDPVPSDVAAVFEWLADAQRRLRGTSHPEVYSQATEGMVRTVLMRTNLPLDAWREAIEGQYLDLRDKPQDKWRWLSLDTLAKPKNFRQARERYIVWLAAEEAKRRHEAERQARDEADAKARKLAADREEAEAQAAIEALDL